MVGVINPPQKTEGGYTIEGWEAASKNTTTTENDFVEAAQGGTFAKGGGKGSGTKGNDSASATESGTPAVSTPAGGASGLVVQTGFIVGMSALVAALML